MKNLALYLAHAFDSRHEIRQWELDFEKRTGIFLFNPFYDSQRKDVLEVDFGGKKKYEGMTFATATQIALKDIQEIKIREGMVAITDENPSCGAIQVMVYAVSLGKQVYSLITNNQEKNPWLMYHSTQIFTKIEELETFLVKLKNGEIN